MTPEEYAKILQQRVLAPTLDESCISAGCQLYGVDIVTRLLILTKNNDKLAEMITIDNVNKFKMRMAIGVVDEPTLRHFIKTKQVASWDRVDELKRELKVWQK